MRIVPVALGVPCSPAQAYRPGVPEAASETLLDSLEHVVYRPRPIMRFALLPAKPIALAKSRLSVGLASVDRESVALSMFEDVLDCLGRAGSIDRVLVVSADPMLLDLADGASAITVDEGSPRGLNGAAALGTRRAIELGATSVLIVLSDLPLARPEEIDALLHSMSSVPHVRMVRSHEGLGTNAILRQPPMLIPTRFGGSSFQGHIAACAEAAVPWSSMNLPGLSFDVDTPGDLERVLSAPGETRTAVVARRIGTLRAKVL